MVNNGSVWGFEEKVIGRERRMPKTKNQIQKEGLYKTVYKCEIYARYLEYRPKPRPIHIKCKTIHMLSEEGKQSLPEFLVGAN